MLEWSQKDLAAHCGEVSEPTIKLIESGKVRSTEGTLEALRLTLEDAGLEFLPQSGVRFRSDLLTVIEKRNNADNAYALLMEDVYQTVKNAHDEVLISFANQALTTPEVLDRQMILRRNGNAMRFLIRYGDTHLLYPLEEYRCLPKGFFINNPTVVYRDKMAIIINDPLEGGIGKVIIIHDRNVAETKRMEFNIIWSYGEKPEKTSMDKTYD